MPRYVIERSFGEALDIPDGPEGREVLGSILACNADRRVTWIQSYVSSDRKHSYCIYEGPSPEAIRLAARASGLPVDRIVEISVLDPYAFSG